MRRPTSARLSELIDDLTDKLCRSPVSTRISMQPNSGAQGEYAGLLTIRAGTGARRGIAMSA
jgi:glycine dehydrogenase